MFTVFLLYQMISNNCLGLVWHQLYNRRNVKSLAVALIVSTVSHRISGFGDWPQHHHRCQCAATAMASPLCPSHKVDHTALHSNPDSRLHSLLHHNCLPVWTLGPVGRGGGGHWSCHRCWALLTTCADVDRVKKEGKQTHHVRHDTTDIFHTSLGTPVSQIVTRRQLPTTGGTVKCTRVPPRQRQQLWRC